MPETKPDILVVDLDGTLVKTDLLHESFWSAFGRDWISPLRATGALLKGRAALKRHLAQKATLDVTTLPYDDAVIAYVRDWRARGGRTALVTATDQALAQAVADHLGLFDEVHGSNGAQNLKGVVKAGFLVDHLDRAPFAYMGDSRADLPVWNAAALAITVDAPPSLRHRAEATAPRTEHLGSPRRDMRAYLRAMRPHQWLKNLLVFLPMLAAHRLDGGTFALALLAFVSFSLVASSVYVLNDLLDLRADRAHPRKRLRPFAAGRAPIAHGAVMAVGLLAGGALTALAIGPPFLLVLAIYYAATTAYSFYLKRHIVIDIIVLAGLYTIRMIAGSVATAIPLSVWLLAFAMFIFLSLAAVKRQAELVDAARRGKLSSSGRGYTTDDLPIISMIAIGSGYVSVLVMALYVNSPNVVDLYHRPQALWAVCAILLYWITRTVMLAHRGQMHDDPVVFAVRDRISQVCFAAIVLFAVAGALV